MLDLSLPSLHREACRGVLLAKTWDQSVVQATQPEGEATGLYPGSDDTTAPVRRLRLPISMIPMLTLCLKNLTKSKAMLSAGLIFVIRQVL